MACTLEFGLLMCLTLMDLYAVTLDDGNIAPSVAVVKEAGRQRIKWSLTPAFIRNVIIEKSVYCQGRCVYKAPPPPSPRAPDLLPVYNASEIPSLSSNTTKTDNSGIIPCSPISLGVLGGVICVGAGLLWVLVHKRCWCTPQQTRPIQSLPYYEDESVIQALIVKDAEIEALHQQLEILQKQLSVTKTGLDTSQAAFRARNIEIDKLKELLEVSEGRLAETRATCHNLESILRETRRAKTDTETEGQRLTIALTRAQAQIADQQQALQERSENVRKLVGLKHETEAELTRLRALLAQAHLQAPTFLNPSQDESSVASEEPTLIGNPPRPRPPPRKQRRSPQANSSSSDSNASSPKPQPPPTESTARPRTTPPNTPSLTPRVSPAATPPLVYNISSGLDEVPAPDHDLPTSSNSSLSTVYHFPPVQDPPSGTPASSTPIKPPISDNASFGHSLTSPITLDSSQDHVTPPGTVGFGVGGQASPPLCIVAAQDTRVEGHEGVQDTLDTEQDRGQDIWDIEQEVEGQEEGAEEVGVNPHQSQDREDTSCQSQDGEDTATTELYQLEDHQGGKEPGMVEEEEMEMEEEEEEEEKEEEEETPRRSSRECKKPQRLITIIK